MQTREEEEMHVRKTVCAFVFSMEADSISDFLLRESEREGTLGSF